MQNVRSQYRRDSSERRSYGKRTPKRLEPTILERVPLDTQVHKQSGGGGTHARGSSTIGIEKQK